MPIPEDVLQLLNTVRASREAEERLRQHKSQQALLLGGKIIEIRGWLKTLAQDLREMLISDEGRTLPQGIVVGVDDVYQGTEIALIAFGHYHIKFAPFIDSAMILAQPSDRQVGGEHQQNDQVTEAWVRRVTLGFLYRHLGADHLERHA